MTDAAQQAAIEKARRLYGQGVVDVGKLAEATGLSRELLLSLTGLWRGDYDRRGTAPRRRAR